MRLTDPVEIDGVAMRAIYDCKSNPRDWVRFVSELKAEAQSCRQFDTQYEDDLLLV